MKFVFLHIEKSAGTSQRAFLKKVYGESAVFWWGLDSDAQTFSELFVTNHSLVGGHRERSFYGASDYIYSSIVREPVDRVISLYNYLVTQNSDEWLKKGLNTDSLLLTLKKCKPFVEMIKNAQCRYISGRGSFEEVKNVLEKESFLIGSFNKLELFNNTFCDFVKKPRIGLGKHNIGKANYKNNIQIDEEVSEILEPLLEEDKKLYEYVTVTNGGLFNSVQSTLWESLNLQIDNNLGGPRKIKSTVVANSIQLKGEKSINFSVLEHEPNFLEESMFVGLRCYSNGKIILEKRIPITSLYKIDGYCKGIFKWQLQEGSFLDMFSIGIVDPSKKKWLNSEVEFFEMSF